MCTHQRVVFNKYTKDSFLCKCGKCKACLQEKAYKRAYRIKCEVSPDTIGLFVTLTYDRASCPFVFQKDIDDRKDILPIYREFYTRRVKRKLKNGFAFLDKRYMKLTKLDEIVFPDYYSFMYRKKIAHLAYRYDHVGVCYFPDIQLFKKRLNINLKRLYNYDFSYKVYSAMEYGETTSRPHAHLLFFIRPSDEAIFRAAISQAWPFASHRRTEKYIEVARDVANYLASYVNCGSDFHPFLSDNFKAKHSYSKDFGMGDKLFSMDSVCSRIRIGDISYLRSVGSKGNETYVRVPIPKYVINRYFPIFKGYSRFTDSQVLDVLRSFLQSNAKPKTPLIDLDSLLSIQYSRDDLHKLGVRLRNAYRRWCTDGFKPSVAFPFPSIEDYVWLHRQAWKVRKNTILKLWYDDNSVDPKYRYDNTQQLFNGIVYSPETLSWMESTQSRLICDPNEYPQVVQRSRDYIRQYNFRVKEKKVNNFVMSQNNYYF